MQGAEYEALEYKLARLQLMIAEQNKLIANMLLFQQVPAFCTIEQACKIKGGSDYTSIRRKIWQQPCCGTRYKYCNGRKVWARADVIEWLKVTDENLEEYAKSMGVDISRYFINGKTKGVKNG